MANVMNYAKTGFGWGIGLIVMLIVLTLFSSIFSAILPPPSNENRMYA
jgi:hypothetical protein